MNKNKAHTISIFILVIFSSMLISGCGLKKWPEPQKSEDSFSWGSIEAERHDNCLFIDIDVQGASGNIDHILVLLEPVGDKFGEGCPGCPFKAKRSVRFDHGSPGFKQVDSRVRLAVCGLEFDELYRWKVVGYNVYRAFRPVSSSVYRPEE